MIPELLGCILDAVASNLCLVSRADMTRTYRSLWSDMLLKGRDEVGFFARSRDADLVLQQQTTINE